MCRAASLPPPGATVRAAMAAATRRPPGLRRGAVAEGGAPVWVDEVGERGRALNTFYRLNRARAFRQWKFKTPWIAPSTARALRALLLGIGDTWRFDHGTLPS